MPGRGAHRHKYMMRYCLHTFRPTETIDAVIRLRGRHSLTPMELIPLRHQFDLLNGRHIPRPGMTYKIPLPFETTDDFGNIVGTPVPYVPEDEGI